MDAWLSGWGWRIGDHRYRHQFRIRGGNPLGHGEKGRNRHDGLIFSVGEWQRFAILHWHALLLADPSPMFDECRGLVAQRRSKFPRGWETWTVSIDRRECPTRRTYQHHQAERSWPPAGSGRQEISMASNATICRRGERRRLRWFLFVSDIVPCSPASSRYVPAGHFFVELHRSLVNGLTSLDQPIDKDRIFSNFSMNWPK